jgi:hypothetical protein
VLLLAHQFGPPLLIAANVLPFRPSNTSEALSSGKLITGAKTLQRLIHSGTVRPVRRVVEAFLVLYDAELCGTSLPSSVKVGAAGGRYSS